jgi:hypothetical protein
MTIDSYSNSDARSGVWLSGQAGEGHRLQALIRGWVVLRYGWCLLCVLRLRLDVEGTSTGTASASNKCSGCVTPWQFKACCRVPQPAEPANLLMIMLKELMSAIH